MATLTWIGKEKVINHHLEVPFRTLKHQYTYKDGKELTDGTRSENKIIHGDNLEALKSLLPEYEGKIKCIYIDPPYNTGNESWVYNDNVNHPKIKKWIGEVVGKEGEDLSRHDKWLCMMYPRLKLLHKLLKDNGFIFISLDDNEINSTRFLLNEIFGERNFQAQIVIQSNKRGHTYKELAKTHEYLLCYSKTPRGKLFPLPAPSDHLPYKDQEGSFSIRELRNRNPKFGRFNRPNLYYPIFVNPNLKDENGYSPVSIIKDEQFNIEVLPLNSRQEESCWRWGVKKLEDNIQDGSTKTVFAKQKQTNEWGIYEKYRKATVSAKTIWEENDVITEQGTTLLKELGLREKFPFPKPIGLIKKVIYLTGDDEGIYLDSFAGSGTTGHAVMEVNNEDAGKRKFILIELEDYANEVTAERIKKVSENYGNGEFEFLEISERLFTTEGFLNEDQSEQDIRKYVYYAETRTNSGYSERPRYKYYLGKHKDIAYYFKYEKNVSTTLDIVELTNIDIKAEQYVIYADKCSVSEDLLREKKIIFKKIPRDITRI